MTSPMSTSLKVVSMAAVCCASTRRAATRWRSGDIFSRDTPREGPADAGACWLRSPPVERIAASTSCSRMRPLGPVPVTDFRSIPFSAASFLARGVERMSPAGAVVAAPFVSRPRSAGVSCVLPPFAGAPLVSRAAGRSGSLVAVAGLASWLASPPACAFLSAEPAPPPGFSADSSMEPTTAPTSTVSPSAAPCLTMPAAGAGSSMVILSVSSSRTVSSRSTHSPSALVHAAMTPLVTLSPTVGMTMSVAMKLSPFSRRLRAWARRRWR